MKYSLNKITKFLWDNLWLVILVITLASFFLRLWHLGYIKEEIFDEVYFVNFAKNYLSHTEFFDIHPPLGKLIIALGIKVFGDTHFGWRIMSAIFGTLIIPLMYWTGKELANKAVGFFAALIMTFDGLFLVYSRTGLIDIFLSFFILLGFYLILKFANSQKIYWLVFASIVLGLAASVKYIGWLLLLVYIAVLVVKRVSFKKYWYYYFSFLLIPAAIYLGFFLFNYAFNANFLKNVIEWHKNSFSYNINLKDTHPYGSKWWSWYLLLRPIWLYFKDNNGFYTGVIGMGNPLAWWSSVVIVPLLIWGVYKKNKLNMIILAGFLIFWLFWAPFNRVLFYYHAMTSSLFLMLGLAFWLNELRKEKGGIFLVCLYFAVLISFFIFFLPIWMGIPINSAQFYHRTWLKGWI